MVLPLSNVCWGISVTYNTTFRKYKNVASPMVCTNVLDISSDVSCFYCPDNYRGEIVKDSLLRLGYSGYDVISVLKEKELLRQNTNIEVFKNYPSLGNLTYISKVWDDFKYEEPIPQFEWRLIDADTLILGYVAYKAETTYRGRTWIVYYTPDIAINDGPWKLCGLPGLILYAKDIEGDFVFNAIGIEGNNKRSTLEPIKKEYKHCDAKQLANLLVLEAKDEEASMQRVWGFHGATYDAQGNRKSPRNKDACLIEIP